MSDKKTRTRYPVELRQDVVRLVVEGGKKCADVVATHQVPVASVYAWVRHARVDEGASKTIGEPALAALEADNARLRKRAQAGTPIETSYPLSAGVIVIELLVGLGQFNGALA